MAGEGRKPRRELVRVVSFLGVPYSIAVSPKPPVHTPRRTLTKLTMLTDIPLLLSFLFQILDDIYPLLRFGAAHFCKVCLSYRVP